MSSGKNARSSTCNITQKAQYMYPQWKSSFSTRSLRNNPTFSALCWVALAALLLAGVWGYIFVSLANARALAADAGAIRTARLASDYAEQVQRTLQNVDHALLTAQWEYEEHAGIVPLTKLSIRGLIPPSREILVMLADASGQIHTTTRRVAHAQPARAETRSHPFTGAAYVAGSVLVETAAYEPVLDKTAIRMSRGLAKAGGFYAGAVIAAVPVSTFEAIFGEEVLDSTDSVSLVGKDGRPRVHYGTGPALPEIIDNHTLEEAVGARWVAATAADPQPYYLAWKHVSDSPLLVVVSRSEAGILRPFLEKRALYLRAGAVTTALLVLFGFVAAWLSARLAVRYRQELATRVAYRAASEGALDGFFILDALRDPNGVVRAFRVADCNQRAAELMGLTRGDMLERELSQIMSPSMAAKVTASYARIVATGQGTRLREFIPESDSPLKAAWVAHQAVPTENGIAVTFRDISAAKTHDRELEDQARVDTLTGLPNRRWLTENLPAAISACAAKQASAALLFIDLDNFKTANDTLGHALGDQLLQAVAKRVRAAIRDVDVLCRLGGDEFTVILGIVETAQEAAAVSERILTALRQPFSIAGHETMVGSSIGISLYPANGLDADTLIKHADLAMYRAKELGKGGFQFFAPHLSAHVEKKLALENDLRLAIERNEFVLAYQPKMAASAGRVIGLEALIRWNSPTRGRVPPGDFIAVAEKTGLICPIGVIVLETACRQLAAWRAQGFALLPVSINVSPCQFNRTDVVADIQAALERYDLPGALLEVEVTESAIMEQPEMAREKLLPLRALGVRIAIDDFGTGYSSLAHLKSLDVDVLKIDRSFIADITNTAGARALVGAVITLAAALGIEVIAEGVETSGQLDFLTSVGCDRIQGFLFSKPVEAGDVHAVIQSLQQPPAETRLVA